MKILDKIEIENQKYICTQIIFLKELTVYRVHEQGGNQAKFVMKKDNNYEEVTQKNILEELYQLLKVKNTDIIIH